VIRVSIEVHSISQIEKQAAQAFASGGTNPYEDGSIAHRIWARRYEKCVQQGQDSANNSATGEKA
jgi:hypothetical protein